MLSKAIELNEVDLIGVENGYDFVNKFRRDPNLVKEYEVVTIGFRLYV